MTSVGGGATARPPVATPVGLLAPSPASTAEVAPCTVADLPHVYGLAMRGLGVASQSSGRRRAVETVLDDIVFVARTGGRPVGYVALGGVPPNALTVDQFLVAPGHEPSEIGDALLLEAQKWGTSEHARTLRVVVGERDWMARGFYRRRGFVPVASDVFELSLTR